VKRVSTLALLAALVLTTPASAQIFGGRRQDEQIADLQRQISEMQVLLNGAGETRGLVAAHTAVQAEVAAARNRVNDLEATLRTLNGTVETLTGELAQARRDLGAAQAQNNALTERIARLESAQAEVATRAVTQARAEAVAANPSSAFAEARALLQAGRFAEAGTAFEATPCATPNSRTRQRPITGWPRP
jgi:chromosome segregation ATPase